MLGLSAKVHWANDLILVSFTMAQERMVYINRYQLQPVASTGTESRTLDLIAHGQQRWVY
jgi:hypothetical protein